jgi:hypothetical protein
MTKNVCGLRQLGFMPTITPSLSQVDCGSAPHCPHLETPGLCWSPGREQRGRVVDHVRVLRLTHTFGLSVMASQIVSIS